MARFERVQTDSARSQEQLLLKLEQQLKEQEKRLESELDHFKAEEMARFERVQTDSACSQEQLLLKLEQQLKEQDESWKSILHQSKEHHDSEMNKMVNIPSNTKEVEEPVVVSALAPEPKPSRVVLDSSSASELEQSQSMMVHDLKLNPSDKKEVRRELEQSAFKSLEDWGSSPYVLTINASSLHTNQSGVKSKDFTFIMAKVNSLEDQDKGGAWLLALSGELDLSLDGEDERQNDDRSSSRASGSIRTSGSRQRVQDSPASAEGREHHQAQDGSTQQQGCSKDLQSHENRDQDGHVDKANCKEDQKITVRAKEEEQNCSSSGCWDAIALRSSVSSSTGTPATPRTQAVNSVHTPAAARTVIFNTSQRSHGTQLIRGPDDPVVFLGAASYEYQPQVDITFGAASIQMIKTTEDEAPAASEEVVRKEQVRPEESVSCITENFQAFMTDLSHEESDGEEQLQVMVELVFKRAVQKPHSAAVFSELCQHLSTVEVQSLSDWSASVSFRSLLVKHCQAAYSGRVQAPPTTKFLMKTHRALNIELASRLPSSQHPLVSTLSKMAAPRLPLAALSLKQFLQRQKVLGIYRNMLRTIKKVPDEADRKYLRDWARDEFKRNRNATEQDAIRMMITQANKHLEELQGSLALATLIR
ncbi:unnamed protein product [Pleuronectes platessa]|uniref:LYR motif-containing protein 2 n=2 Tax=Pleuronectes platessa TaxID=8262 RepID=A0A9N7USH8_PLEPL|nr:unnamed protein product [Pleuronectes platessa]